jgi:DNA replication protein DnaC
MVPTLGAGQFDLNAAYLFIQLLSKRYGKSATLITSSRGFGEWGDVFGDPVVVTATQDRLLHQSHVVTIKGESYRLKSKRGSGIMPAKPAAIAVNSYTTRESVLSVAK